MPARRITYVITNADLGGAQRHLITLAEASIAEGYVVEVIVGETGPTCSLLTQHGVAVQVMPDLKRTLGILSDIRATKILRRALLHSPPDLIHLHSSKAGLIGRIAAWRLNIPVIYTAHGWGFKTGVPLLRRALVYVSELATAALATRIICVSHYDHLLASRWLPFVRDRLVLIQNGVPDTRKRANPASRPVKLVMVARFQEPKLQTLLIAALPRLSSEIELELVGDGPLKASAEQFARNVGVDHRVRFLGDVVDVHEILKSCHVFVMLSSYEGLPMSILEAMAAGLPCVASAVGGVPEIIEDGTTGFLIKQNTEDAVVTALTHLIENHAARASMGAAGRSRYEKMFSSSSMASSTLALYREASFRHW